MRTRTATLSSWRRQLLALFCILTTVFAAVPASAQLSIEIIGAGETQIPIAVVPFANETPSAISLTGIISSDLNRSGLFKMLDASGINPRPSDATPISHLEWRSRGANAVVVGSMNPQPDGGTEIRFRLYDTINQKELVGLTYSAQPAQFRQIAHKIADVVYEKLTGSPGVFSTKIAYIVKQGRRYELQVADADGYNPQAIVTSNEPLFSPAWSPEGNRIAYVSLENKKPVIYIQNVSTGHRQLLANFKGSNSAPAWSPDGTKLAITLTKDGISQLYLINADGSGLQRLTTSTAIDTEANFLPDGQSLLFLSDRGGGPQVYKLSLASGTVERQTFEGAYNVSPRASPDGKGFAFIKRDGGRFNVAFQDFANRQVTVLTQGHSDESPSIAPNGRLILYASDIGGRGILAAVSNDGRVKQRLVASSGDVREPAWGPIAKN